MPYLQGSDGRIFYFAKIPEQESIRTDLTLLPDKIAERILAEQEAAKPVVVDEVQEALHSLLRAELLRSGKTQGKVKDLLG